MSAQDLVLERLARLLENRPEVAGLGVSILHELAVASC